MNDSRLTNLANILVNYSIAVHPGDWVLINSHVLALPLATPSPDKEEGWEIRFSKDT